MKINLVIELLCLAFVVLGVCLIKDNKLKLDELQNSDEYLEKFASEKYLMKKADEEIFIIK